MTCALSSWVVLFWVLVSPIWAHKSNVFDLIPLCRLVVLFSKSGTYLSPRSNIPLRHRSAMHYCDAFYHNGITAHLLLRSKKWRRPFFVHINATVIRFRTIKPAISFLNSRTPFLESTNINGNSLRHTYKSLVSSSDYRCIEHFLFSLSRTLLIKLQIVRKPITLYIPITNNTDYRFYDKFVHTCMLFE